MCVRARVCVSVKLHRRKKSISDVMKMQIVSLVSTCAVSQHHNAPSLFTLSQNGLQSITALSHFHHSLQINQSPLLLCFCYCYVHSLFLHRFLWTVSSLPTFSAVSLYCIQSEAAFNWCKKKSWGQRNKWQRYKVNEMIYRLVFKSKFCMQLLLWDNQLFFVCFVAGPHSN